VSPYFRRKKPGARENAGAALAALGLAAGVAAVTFYLVRLTLSRETLASPGVLKALPREPAAPGGDAGDAPSSGPIPE
jgi:hypothetical protein